MIEFKRKAYNLMINLIVFLIVAVFIIGILMIIGFMSLGLMRVLQMMFEIIGL